MAKQNGLVKLLGTVGDMTYYRSKDGFLAKEKTSLTAERIASDPKFKRTRENMAEFGDAGKSGKALRHSVSLLLKDAKDNKVVSRLTKVMMLVLKTDTTSKRGQRKVAKGDTTLLKGFEFNAGAILATTFFAPYTTTISRTAGTLGVTIPAFTPTSSIVAPEGATHFKLVSAATAIDFTKEKYVTGSAESGILPWDENLTTDINMQNTVTANSPLPLILVFGIQFLQEVNGIQYPLTNGSFNTLSVIEVDVA